jgi:hypothetical protein
MLNDILIVTFNEFKSLNRLLSLNFACFSKFNEFNDLMNRNGLVEKNKVYMSFSVPIPIFFFIIHSMSPIKSLRSLRATKTSLNIPSFSKIGDIRAFSFKGYPLNELESLNVNIKILEIHQHVISLKISPFAKRGY